MFEVLINIFQWILHASKYLFHDKNLRVVLYLFFIHIESAKAKSTNGFFILVYDINRAVDSNLNRRSIK